MSLILARCQPRLLQPRLGPAAFSLGRELGDPAASQLIGAAIHVGLLLPGI